MRGGASVWLVSTISREGSGDCSILDILFGVVEDRSGNVP